MLDFRGIKLFFKICCASFAFFCICSDSFYSSMFFLTFSLCLGMSHNMKRNGEDHVQFHHKRFHFQPSCVLSEQHMGNCQKGNKQELGRKAEHMQGPYDVYVATKKVFVQDEADSGINFGTR